MVDIMEKGHKNKKKSKKHFQDTVFILHGGGTYGDKKKTMKRWVKNYKKLPLNMRKWIVLENDERNYSPMDLIEICEKNKIPICLDTFH